MTSIKLITEIRNASLCFPAGVHGQVIATKGDISYIYNRQRMPNPFTLLHMQANGKLGNLYKGDDAYEHKITLKSLELFKCERDEYYSLPVDEVRKRSVVMPFSFFLGVKNELHISQTAVYFHNKYECNFDKTVLKFSYKDLIVVVGILEHFKEQA